MSNQHIQELEMKAKIVIGLLIGVVVGVLLSQYSPIFGGIEKIGLPWSPVRRSLISIHVIGLGLLGALTGPALAWLKSKKI
jgi:Na+/H+-dicarboxylate symporter